MAMGAVAGGVIGGAISYGLQKDSQSNQRNILQNQKQWLVADLRRAGLNPILAAGGLGGQVAGSGGIASPSSIGDIGEAGRRQGLYDAVKAKANAEAGTAKYVEQTSRMMMDRAQWENIPLRVLGRWNESPEGRKSAIDHLKNTRTMDPFKGHGMWSLGAAGVKGGIDNTTSGTAKSIADFMIRWGIVGERPHDIKQMIDERNRR